MLNPVTPGIVKFCNASARHCVDSATLGSAQLTSAGVATVQLRLGVGTHNIAAVFLETATYPGSTSSTQSVVVNGTGSYFSGTILAASGSTGDYTLSSSVAGYGIADLSGLVSLVDTTNGNIRIGSASLTTPSFALEGPTTETASRI
jgi:hypothetical protein